MYAFTACRSGSRWCIRDPRVRLARPRFRPGTTFPCLAGCFWVASVATARLLSPLDMRQLSCSPQRCSRWPTTYPRTIRPSTPGGWHGDGGCKADGIDWRFSGNEADTAGFDGGIADRKRVWRLPDHRSLAKAAGPQTEESPSRTSCSRAQTVMAFRYVDLSQFSDTFWCIPWNSRFAGRVLGRVRGPLVLGNALIKALQNPLIFKMALLAFICCSAFLIGILLIRAIRKNVSYKAESERVAAENSPLFSLAAYNGVIQQLREQEKELKSLRQQERERAAATENISDAVLSNLSSGVVFFDRMGLVRQVNAAAKSLLGYASPFNFHIRDLFRGIREVRWPNGTATSSPGPFVAEMERTIREATPFQRVEADYVTPVGETRVLGRGASAVRARNGDILGVSCLIRALTQITELSRQMRLQENLASLGEMSAGIAHEFKNSLATISGYAQMLAQESGESNQQFAAKIASETESLARIVTEFLG